MFKKEEIQKTPEYWLEAIQNELYKQVVDYMKREGINQTELAEKLGVSKGYISQILKGQFNYTLKKLIELSISIGKIPNIQFEGLEEFIKNQEKKHSKESWVVVYTTKHSSTHFNNYIKSNMHKMYTSRFSVKSKETKLKVIKHTEQEKPVYSF